jgi:acyl-[acyl carrier protein]--UDP-N-acetylglucosamine O-acyltransferase
MIKSKDAAYIAMVAESESNANNLNNVRHETRKTFRNKEIQRLKQRHKLIYEELSS